MPHMARLLTIKGAAFLSIDRKFICFPSESAFSKAFRIALSARSTRLSRPFIEIDFKRARKQRLYRGDILQPAYEYELSDAFTFLLFLQLARCSQARARLALYAPLFSQLLLMARRALWRRRVTHALHSLHMLYFDESKVEI